ncbi:LysR family transcriptional regulator [Microbacterium faecale]|uniref:LysR family transcriptional regulator n=1 Tax=Microbacterium faecale TaxID=1804630 RepID=A0A916Y5R2_9MICO|nr:LysR family transcriptional regulator [Microbacterium faecale]GGD31594.1 LysR family transcriptional regulator [Microbacterium faecale]
MRIDQLRYVAAVMSSRSMRQAAQALGITQPSLSQQIQRLEEDLGVVLFVRGSTGVSPTSAATFLEPHIRAMLSAERTMRQAASSISDARVGHVYIGAVPTVCRTILPTAVHQFRQEHPNIEFEVTELGSHQVWEGVTNGDFDLGLISRVASDAPLNAVTTVDLIASQTVMCVPTDHPLAHAQVITPEDLVGEPLIVFQRGFLLRRIFDEMNIDGRLTAIFHTASIDTARALVTAGVGLAVLPEIGIPEDDVASGKYRVVPLEATLSATITAAIRRVDEYPSPPALGLLNILRTLAVSRRGVSW